MVFCGEAYGSTRLCGKKALNEFVSSQTKCFDVIVIGGGLAGLASALRIKLAGASVVLLEARNRVGGRLHSQRIESGHTIDLGAQFIGDSQPRISALVDEVGLTRVSPHNAGKSAFLMSPSTNPVFKSGDGLPLSLIGKLDMLVSAWRLNCKLRTFRHDIEWLDSLAASEFLRKMSFTRQSADFLANYIEGEMCVSLQDLSAYELLDQLASVGGLDGEGGSAQWYLAEGTEPLAQHLANQLGDRLVLNAPVVKIEQKNEWVSTDTETGTYRGRHVIIALPPQLYGSIGLLPSLPEERRRVILDYQCGNVVKTILVFASPWWRDLGASGRVFSVGSIFNAVVDGSPADGHLGILVLFSSATSAVRISRLTAENDRIAHAFEWLKTLSGSSVPQPIAAHSIDWNGDSFSLGGYASRRGKGAWCAVPDLFAPSNRVHFAGTETATEWRSFMEGALQSAERVTAEVLAALTPSYRPN